MFCDAFHKGNAVEAQRRCQRRYCYGYLKVKNTLSSKGTRSDILHKGLQILPIGINTCLSRLCSGVSISPCCMICDLVTRQTSIRKPTPKSKAYNANAARWFERAIVRSIDIYEFLGAEWYLDNGGNADGTHHDWPPVDLMILISAPARLRVA